MSPSETPNAGAMLKRFKALFWLPPRAHGDVIVDRTVSFLELFYDLVYVVVIARAAHTLAEHLTWRGVGEFAAVFGMIWIAWLNGTLYQDLHGREDGRSRTFIFLQMMILALLAVFTADAAGDGGQGFAVVYTAFLIVLTWLWFSVRRQDTEAYSALTARYLGSMIGSAVLIGVSAFLPNGARVIVWAVFVVATAVGAFVIERTPVSGEVERFRATESMVERFGLFTIIVLGEVVVGVVTGLSEVERDARAVVTGIVGLMIGFGIWWTYFDFVGRRRPREDGASVLRWVFSHLPVSMAIAASGAAMVSLVEHAGDSRAPAESAWLLTGSVAIALAALVVAMQSLQDYQRLATIYRPLFLGLAGAAAAVMVVGWARPVPWLLVLLVVAVLSAVWWLAVDRWLRLDDPSEIQPR